MKIISELHKVMLLPHALTVDTTRINPFTSYFISYLCNEPNFDDLPFLPFWFNEIFLKVTILKIVAHGIPLLLVLFKSKLVNHFNR